MINTKRCVVCVNEIPKGASKCSICNSYQNWFRRQLTFSSLVLSLLISLFAVLGLAIPKLDELIYPPNTKIVFKQSNTETSRGTFTYNQYISTYSGEDIGLEFKDYFRPEYPERVYSFYQNDDNSLMIDYGPDSIVIKPNRVQKPLALQSDSLYYLIREELIIDLRFEFLIRNIGKKYGVIHYLKLADSPIKIRSKFFDDHKYDILLSISNSDPEITYYHPKLKNKKISPEYLEAVTFQIIDTLNIFSLSDKDQNQFQFPYFDTTFQKQNVCFPLEPLIFNHDDSIDTTRVDIEMKLLVNSEKFNTDLID